MSGHEEQIPQEGHTTASMGRRGRKSGRADDDSGQMMEQAQEKASQVTDNAKSQASQQMAMGKDRAADQISSLADAMRQMSDSLQEQDQNAIANYSDQAADQIDRMANYLQEKDIGDMVGEVERFARRQPAIFLGGAFALGLLGARFLKASSPEGSGTDYPRGYGYGYRDSDDTNLTNRATADRTVYDTPRYAGTPRQAQGYAHTPPVGDTSPTSRPPYGAQSTTGTSSPRTSRSDEPLPGAEE